MTLQMVGHAVDGNALERRRRGLGLSREALGAAAGGLSSATIKRVERGLVRRPHPVTIAAIVAALDRADNPTNTTSRAAEPDSPENSGRLSRRVPG
jgi:transcriptional regulator with XRE-family HTH domain